MKLDKYLIVHALETLLEQVRDAGEEFKVINRVIKEIEKIKKLKEPSEL